MRVCSQKLRIMLDNNKLAITDKSTSAIHDPPWRRGAYAGTGAPGNVESSISLLVISADDHPFYRPSPIYFF